MLRGCAALRRHSRPSLPRRALSTVLRAWAAADQQALSSNFLNWLQAACLQLHVQAERREDELWHVSASLPDEAAAAACCGTACAPNKRAARTAALVRLAEQLDEAGLLLQLSPASASTALTRMFREEAVRRVASGASIDDLLAVAHELAAVGSKSRAADASSAGLDDSVLTTLCNAAIARRDDSLLHALLQLNRQQGGLLSPAAFDSLLWRLSTLAQAPATVNALLSRLDRADGAAAGLLDASAFRSQMAMDYFMHWRTALAREQAEQSCAARVADALREGQPEQQPVHSDLRLLTKLPGWQGGCVRAAVGSKDGLEVVDFLPADSDASSGSTAHALPRGLVRDDIVVVVPSLAALDSADAICAAIDDGRAWPATVLSSPQGRLRLAGMPHWWQSAASSPQSSSSSSSSSSPPPPPASSWDVVQIGADATFARMHSALLTLCCGSDDGDGVSDDEAAAADKLGSIAQLVLYGKQAGLPRSAAAACAAAPTSASPGFPLLNTSQQAAVEAARRQAVTVVRGPPGSGKTRTGVEIVRSWLADDDSEPILVTADSNVAVDNVIHGLRDCGVAAMSLGWRASSPHMRDAMRAHAEWDDYQLAVAEGDGEEAARCRFAIMSDLLHEVDVVGLTCSASASTLVEAMDFSRVLVDEAAQAIEAATLIPLARGGVQQLVLMGDDQQLPATVLSPAAERAGLSVSLFQRLADADSFLLDTQYRMHPALSAWPNKQFYAGKLRDGISSHDRPAPAGFAWPNEAEPLAFLSCKPADGAGGEQRVGRSRQNVREAEVVVQTACALLAAGDVTPSSLGIITPYAAQQSLLRSLLQRALPAGQLPTIATVDGFQGAERDVILFSAVRSNSRRSLGFLRDARRMNVMLTRAKRGLIVVGDERTLAADALWRSWIEDAWNNTQHAP